LAVLIVLGVVQLARPDLENQRGAALQTLSGMVPDPLKDLGRLVTVN